MTYIISWVLFILILELSPPHGKHAYKDKKYFPANIWKCKCVCCLYGSPFFIQAHSCSVWQCFYSQIITYCNNVQCIVLNQPPQFLCKVGGGLALLGFTDLRLNWPTEFIFGALLHKYSPMNQADETRINVVKNTIQICDFLNDSLAVL